LHGHEREKTKINTTRLKSRTIVDTTKEKAKPAYGHSLLRPSLGDQSQKPSSKPQNLECNFLVSTPTASKESDDDEIPSSTPRKLTSKRVRRKNTASKIMIRNL
jgi:hypothetical protein